MKKVFRNTVALFMAFVVLFSTMSFTIDKHYCGDTLVGMAIFKEAKSCGMERQNTAVPAECSITKKNCCSNSQVVVEGQDELQLTYDVISIDQQVFLYAYITSYIYLFGQSEERVTHHIDYVPPPVIKQIYKLDETYLI